MAHQKTKAKAKGDGERPNAPRPWLGLIAGAASGLIAAGMMNGMQAAVTALSRDKGEDAGKPATVKAADKVSEAATGLPVPAQHRKDAGQAVHYLTGAALGALYGVVAEYEPDITSGFGTAFGTATSLVLDDAIVPALGLGDAPWKSTPATLAYGLASHLVFGATLEGSRSVLIKGLDER